MERTPLSAAFDVVFDLYLNLEKPGPTANLRPDLKTVPGADLTSAPGAHTPWAWLILRQRRTDPVA